MAFQLCALIISVLIISLLILKGLHPILSVIIGSILLSVMLPLIGILSAIG